MRLAFCFMSNNIDRFYQMYNSFHYTCDNSIINSYTKNVLFNPPIKCTISGWDDWNIKWKCYHTKGPIDFFSLRQDSLSLAENAELIFVGDDDFIFKEGSIEIINQCCQYMYLNKDCGAIYLGNNFGELGKEHKDEIWITNCGHLNTNRGIILRNRPVLMDNNLHALGACEDSIIAFTVLMQGYYVARRAHVEPYITHSIGKNIIMENHVDINYDLKFLKSKGIFARVNDVISNWPDQNEWPKRIFKIYRQEAMEKGFIPRYWDDGEII